MGPPETIQELSADSSIPPKHGVEETAMTPDPGAMPSPTTAIRSAGLGSSEGNSSSPSPSNLADTGATRAFPLPDEIDPTQDPHERTNGAEDPPSKTPPAQGIAQSEQERAFFNVLEKFMKPRNPTEAPEAWEKLADTAWAYEKDRADRWRNEINTLLVFAGLFSAVLTAFVVQLYAVLLPTPDPNTAILERISAQLGNMATDAVVAAASASALVPTVPTNTSSTTASSPPAAPRWIAALWFVALVFSLSAASVGLAVNQWLNFHATEKAGLQDASQKAWTWQLRRHAMDKWKVEFMVGILPFLLQVALVLFLVGIVGYLWELGFDIAIPSTVFVGVLFLFLAFTSVSPALVDYSAYKSPQAWWIRKACKPMWPVVYWVLLQLCRTILPFVNRVDSWIFSLTGSWSSDSRVARIYTQIQKIRDSLFQRQLYMRTLMEASDWLAHEQVCLGDWTTRSEAKSLLKDIYSIADDTDVLRAMATCVRAMPIARAIENVTGIGQTVATALSKQQDSRSRAYGPSRSVPGDRLLSDGLDSTATALIGRMVADTFIQAQTKLELGDIRLSLDPICHTLIAITPTMPFADGIEVCKWLFQCLGPDDADIDGSLRPRRDQGTAETILKVTAMGEALFAALSNHQYPPSRVSESSSPESGNLAQHDDSVSTTIASIGRMVLDTFTLAHTEPDDSPPSLDLDFNRCLAGLIRAMPLADGIEACMTLFRCLHSGKLSTERHRAALDVIQNVYLTIDFLAEDIGYWQRDKMKKVRTFDCAPQTELYRRRDVQDWGLVQTALTTIYAHHDPVSTIQITTTVLAICMLSAQNEHTLPAEPSRGAYLADMLHRFDEHLATLRRQELQNAIRDLHPAAIYRLDWVLYRMGWYINRSLSTTEIRRNVMMSTNHIARRLQWLLECDDWAPPGTVQGFSVDLQLYVERTQWRLGGDHGIDQDSWRGWLKCAPDEPQSEGDRRVDSPQVTDSESTWEVGDEQDPPEPGTDSPKRAILQIIRDVWRKFRGTAAHWQELDVEMQGVDTRSSAASDASSVIYIGPPAVSGAPQVTATTLDESISLQWQDESQTGSVKSLDHFAFIGLGVAL